MLLATSGRLLWSGGRGGRGREHGLDEELGMPGGPVTGGRDVLLPGRAVQPEQPGLGDRAEQRVRQVLR